MSMLILFPWGYDSYRRITVAGDIRATPEGDIRIHDRDTDEANRMAWTEENDGYSVIAAVVGEYTIAWTEDDDTSSGSLLTTQNAFVSPDTIELEVDFGLQAVNVSANPATIVLDTELPVPGIQNDEAATISPPSIDLDVALDGFTVNANDGAESSSLTIDINLDLGMTAVPESALRVSPDGQPLPYRVILFEPGGQTPIASLDNAEVGDINWELNSAGSFNFTLPIFDDKISELRTAEREVQVWRGPDLLWWGVIIRATVNVDVVSFQCLELGWYFSRRVVGTEEVNFVKNGDFESGSMFWYLNQYAPSEPLVNRVPSYSTCEVRKGLSISGSNALYMESDERLTWGIQARNFFPWQPDPGENPDGEEWTVVAWCYIPSDKWRSPRVREYDWDRNVAPFGMFLQRIDPNRLTQKTIYGVGTITVGTLLETVVLPITEDTPRDTWIRFEAPLLQPITGVEESINVLLGCPHGAVYWDRISLVRTEKLFFQQVDQATILKELVEHAQDTSIDKSDLNIATDCQPTGVPRDRTYFYYNHELISDTIDEWPQLFDGMDWSIEITPTTRTFTSHYPQRGTYKPKYSLILGKNVSSVTVDVDGEQTSNKVMVLADGGDGAAREEAITLDDTALDAGLVLEKVYNATPGSAINTLQAQANRGVARYKDPVIMPDITCYSTETDDLIMRLQVGDIVDVVVERGWISLIGLYRIIGITLDPITNELTFSVNPYANWDLQDFQ